MATTKMEMTNSDMPAALREYRIGHNFTQEYIARQLSCTKALVSKIESGFIPGPELRKRILILLEGYAVPTEGGTREMAASYKLIAGTGADINSELNRLSDEGWKPILLSPVISQQNQVLVYVMLEKV